MRWELLAGLWAVKIALGCSCGPTLPPCASIGEGNALFLGRVVDFGESAGLRRATFEVQEWFRGQREGKVVVETGLGGTDCGYPFQAGVSYLVYAYPADGDLMTNICTRTAPVEAAEEDLAFLRSLLQKGPEGTIYGHVASERQNYLEPYSGKAALRGIRVWLEGEHQERQASTDDRGEYEFGKLPSGSYKVRAEMPGRLGGGEVREVELSRQGCQVVNFYAHFRATRN